MLSLSEKARKAIRAIKETRETQGNRVCQDFKAQTGLSKFLESMVSAFDTGAKESFYHGFVLW